MHESVKVAILSFITAEARLGSGFMGQKTPATRLVSKSEHKNDRLQSWWTTPREYDLIQLALHIVFEYTEA